jgi:single-strand DNA-binding protein
MFDTYVTIVGNVLTAPEWRRTTQTNSLVANFKVASTARRLNRETGRWVDGNSLRVRVNCWRKLAEGVASSVMVGDPVVVAGRLYTRDWTDAEGTHRTLYELEALAIGHDLSRGRAKFVRNRPTLATSAVEDAEADARVHGERTEPVPVHEMPARPGGKLFDDDDDPDFVEVPAFDRPLYDPVAVLRGGGFDAAAVDSGDAEPAPEEPDGDDVDGDGLDDDVDSDAPGGDDGGTPAGGGPGEPEWAEPGGTEASAGGRRGRRRTAARSER